MLQTTEETRTKNMETRESFETFPEPEPGVVPHNRSAKPQGTKENVPSDELYAIKLLPLAFVRLDNNGVTILRGAEGNIVVQTVGKLVTRRI